MSRIANEATGSYPFPAILGTTFALHFVLLATGTAPFAAAMLPTVAAAVAVAVAEHLLPGCDRWRPTRREIIADAAFMLVVQVLLPRMLTLLTALYVLGALTDNGMTIGAWWPRNASHATQFALALLLASFTRYWLHRAAHAWRPLWRLHAVHHSPDKLYWLNVGRFHPFEKAMQFGVETFPLMVLGVDEAVLGSYFVLYATLGFLSHSNIRMRNPWIGRVFSTAELHRLHHARDPEESSCNFGNLLVIWDVVFGTRRVPNGSTPAALGLTCEDYPQGFLAQLVTPFRGSLHASRRADSTVTARCRRARLQVLLRASATPAHAATPGGRKR